MILKSMLLGFASFILNNCVKSNWEIHNCRILGLQLHNPFIYGFAISIFLRSDVVLSNGNIFGFHVIKARYEIYAEILSSNGFVIFPKVGYVEISDTDIFGSKSGSTAITVDVTIEKLGFLQFLRLFNAIWDDNGAIRVIILGNALIKSGVRLTTTDPLAIVTMKCVENIKIKLSCDDMATVDDVPSNQCQFSYLPASSLSQHFLNSSVRIIDRKYLYGSLQIA